MTTRESLAILAEWPRHPHEPPHELTPEEIRELRAHAATERVATDQQRDGDRELACAANDWAAVHRLRALGLLHYPGGSCELLTEAGREVLERIEAQS